MTSRWAHLFFAAVYLLVMTWVVYAYIDDFRKDGTAALVIVLATSLAVGFLVPRWWVLLLPLALAALSIPAGYPTEDPDVRYEDLPLPTWFVVAFIAPFLATFFAAGRLGRWAVARWL